MTPALAVAIMESKVRMACPQSRLFLCPGSVSVQQILANNIYLPAFPAHPILSLAHYFQATTRAGIQMVICFISGTNVGWGQRQEMIR